MLREAARRYLPLTRIQPLFVSIMPKPRGQECLWDGYRYNSPAIRRRQSSFLLLRHLAKFQTSAPTPRSSSAMPILTSPFFLTDRKRHRGHHSCAQPIPATSRRQDKRRDEWLPGGQIRKKSSLDVGLGPAARITFPGAGPLL